MKTKLYALLLLLSVAVSSWSCTDEEASPAPDLGKLTPIQKNHGATIGQATSKTIGPEGGSIQMPDQSMRLNIPAGAVASATEFSIQQVENTFPGNSAPSFRLLPEGVTFSKPVQLTYSYAEVDLNGSAPEMLYLSYQDEDGFYHVASNTFLHKESKTLTVETTHFSDWTCFENYKIVNEYPYLRVGDMTEPRVKWFMPIGLTDSRIGEWIEVKDKNMSYEWYLAYGAGKVEEIEEGTVGWYTAPATVPAVNPVGVGVKVRNAHFVINKDDPARGNYTNEELLLTAEMFIQPTQFVDYTFNGVTYVIYGDCAETGCIRMDPRGGFYLQINMTDNRYMIINIDGADGVGSYSFGNGPKEGGITVNTGHQDENKRYTTSYSPCNGCNSVYSSGSVKITRWGKDYDDYWEGEYSATLYEKNGSYNPPTKTVSGKFSVRWY